ncbi:MAG: CapA family protein [Oscillospiraceae bacterium]|nr:CapA family protein [Oscillospiraceae bacterium]
MGKKTTFIATGDAFITRRIPENGYPGFAEISDVIKGHDVRFNNLEITVHRQEGYPSATSGGTWAMTEPEVFRDLQRFGFNLFNTATNHTLDYSHGGVLATMKHLRESGALFAGSGANLEEASAPVYLETTNARVAMIAVCSTFKDGAVAGNQSRAMQGRPGLNPLRHETIFHVEREYFDTLKKVADLTALNAEKNDAIRTGYAVPLPEDKLYFGGLSFQCDTENYKETVPAKRDMDRILSNIEEARRQADYVMVSLHAHEFAGEDTRLPADFLRTFCRACIDAGADAILGHGPHELRGIEVYRDKPIFYSLGNFIFQTETVSVQPVDAYENKGMPHDMQVGAYMDERSQKGARGYVAQPNIWFAVMAGLTAEDGRITEVQLYPITLNQTEPRSRRGWPCLMKDRMALEYLQELCEPFGTRLEIRDGFATLKL